MEYSRKPAQHDSVQLFWNMEYSWNIPEKCYNKQNLPFLEYGIFWNIPQKRYHHQSSTLIYQFILSKLLFLKFSGIWNIPKFCLNMIFFQFFGIWNIPKTNGNKENIEIGGIWNIRGIFPKNSKTIKISKILEYGIFHGIFLEYSKNCKTSHGGVKFNQVF